ASSSVVNSTGTNPDWGFNCQQGTTSNVLSQDLSSNSCNAGNISTCLPAGSYFVIAKEAGKCSSVSNLFAIGCTEPAAPTITTNLTSATTSISGTAPANTTTRVFINNVLKNTFSTTNWTINNLTLVTNDTIAAYSYNATG